MTLAPANNIPSSCSMSMDKSFEASKLQATKVANKGQVSPEMQPQTPLDRLK